MQNASLEPQERSVIDQIMTFAAALIRALRIRFDRSPIADLDSLERFLCSRAAYVAQTALYGYLKARMGRDYVSIFKDDAFAPSLNQAKWSVYAACLSDLVIHACARIAEQGKLSEPAACALALHCFDQCLASSFEGTTAQAIAPRERDDFASRVERVHWPGIAIGSAAFSTSPARLADASPVSERFRDLDREIVENSVRFRWHDVRQQVARRLDAPSICRDWHRIANLEDATDA